MSVSVHDAIRPGVLSRLLPGLCLCAAVTAFAFLLARAEERVFGHAWLETLVLAILAGAALRTLWTPPERFAAGVDFSAKTVLEIAVVLLGASVNAATVLATGPILLGAIVCTVALALVGGILIGRMLGLAPRMAVLVACGNAICGNSAIAAVAPVIGADSDDVATSIAFTAVLGVVVVLALPVLAPVFSLTLQQYGVLAGLTVYAVPQVLAATVPVSALSAQVGTLVKLVRVLMLGPVILTLALVGCGRGSDAGKVRTPLRHLVPWFIIGFLGMLTLRSLGAIPQALIPPLESAATWLTILSMAALGLGVDVRVLARSSGRVVAAAVLALLLLAAISLCVIGFLSL